MVVYLLRRLTGMFTTVYNELGPLRHCKLRARGSAGVTASSIIRSALLLLLLALLCSTASPSPFTKGGGLAPRQTGDFAAAAVSAAAAAHDRRTDAPTTDVPLPPLQSPFPKGGGLAPRQTGDFAAAAVPAAADSAPITDHRSPITSAAAAAAPAVLQSPFPKGGGLAPRQTGDFAAAAVPAAADSAPITDHRSPITTAAAAAGPAAPPLLPQPVPALSIQIILDLAHASACRDTAKAIEEDNIAGALAMLDALVSGPFYWRGAVTNGYQQGFFVNALRGYCLERIGDIVKAYRSYQNSRAYFDDQVAAVQCPDPRLEVFLGLGRTCLVAGRYTDAFNWLDLVRLEASATPRIAAAADRGLIRRAVEIGDYHDAITNFWDLQCLLLETGNSKLVAVAEATSNIQHSTLNIEGTAAEQPSKFVRPERLLSREEHKELAHLYFWTHQDRPGFKTLLDGITLLGIDNDLGVRDPMVDAYLNNIMRADDAEIQRFYDLLGYAISQARALKGDEDYLVFLCNARAMMTKASPFLDVSDDLRQTTKRINNVKQNLKRQQRRRPATQMRSILRPRIHSHVCTRSDNTSKDITDPSLVWYEDQMMQLDLDLKHHSSLFHAIEAANMLSKSDLPPLGYDGTTLQNAHSIACAVLLEVLKQAKPGNMLRTQTHQIWRDGSLRAEVAAVRMCCHSLTQDFAVVLDGLTQYALPYSHPAVIEKLDRLITAFLEHKCMDYCERAISQRIARLPAVSARIIGCWTDLVPASNLAEHFKRGLFGLRYSPNSADRACLIGYITSTCIWADEEDLLVARCIGPRALIAGALTDPVVAPNYLRQFQHVLLWSRRFCEYELLIRQLYAMGDWISITNVFSAYQEVDYVPPPLALIAGAYYRLGSTSDAARLTYAALSFAISPTNAAHLRSEITPTMLSALYKQHVCPNPNMYQHIIDVFMSHNSVKHIISP